MRKILTVTKEPDVNKTITRALGDSYSIDQVLGRDEALGLLKKASYDIVFIDLDTLSATQESDNQDYRYCVDAIHFVPPKYCYSHTEVRGTHSGPTVLFAH